MEIKPGRTFRLGDGLAVCLPDDIGFGIGDDVVFEQDGDSVTIRRKPRYTGKDLADALRALPKPTVMLKREPIDWPERAGFRD